MNKINFYRKELRLSQYELAAATQIPRWRIQLFESGILEPSSEELDRLRLILGEMPSIKESELGNGFF